MRRMMLTPHSADQRDPEIARQREDQQPRDQQRISRDQRAGDRLLVLQCSGGGESISVAPADSSIATMPMMPNQTTGLSEPSAGSVKSRSRCACQSRSKPSL